MASVYDGQRLWLAAINCQITSNCAVFQFAMPLYITLLLDKQRGKRLALRIIGVIIYLHFHAVKSY
jgi:hypothetical protein